MEISRELHKKVSYRECDTIALVCYSKQTKHVIFQQNNHKYVYHFTKASQQSLSERGVI